MSIGKEMVVGVAVHNTRPPAARASIQIRSVSRRCRLAVAHDHDHLLNLCNDDSKCLAFARYCTIQGASPVREGLPRRFVCSIQTHLHQKARADFVESATTSTGGCGECSRVSALSHPVRAISGCHKSSDTDFQRTKISPTPSRLRKR